MVPKLVEERWGPRTGAPPGGDGEGGHGQHRQSQGDGGERHGQAGSQQVERGHPGVGRVTISGVRTS